MEGLAVQDLVLQEDYWVGVPDGCLQETPRILRVIRRDNLGTQGTPQLVSTGYWMSCGAMTLQAAQGTRWVDNAQRKVPYSTGCLNQYFDSMLRSHTALLPHAAGDV